jgi:hypothetical protein
MLAPELPTSKGVDTAISAKADGDETTSSGVIGRTDCPLAALTASSANETNIIEQKCTFGILVVTEFAFKSGVIIAFVLPCLVHPKWALQHPVN